MSEVDIVIFSKLTQPPFGAYLRQRKQIQEKLKPFMQINRQQKPDKQMSCC